MEKVDVIVIGSGPAGGACANRLAKANKKVVLIESGITSESGKDFGGTCLHIGCMPSKALLNLTENYDMLTHGKIPGVPILEHNPNLKAIVSHKNEIVQKLNQGNAAVLKATKVQTVLGTATLKSKNHVEVATPTDTLDFEAEAVVIATGATPIQLEGLTFDQKFILDSTQALKLSELPEKALVVGAGAIGLEIASIWKRLGVEVTICEALERPFPKMDKDVYARIKKEVLDTYHEVKLGTKVKSHQLTDEGVEVVFEYSGSEAKKQQSDAKALFDQILVAVGRAPNTSSLQLENVGVMLDQRGFITVDDSCQTNIEGVYAIGDVAAQLENHNPMLAHRATQEGLLVADLLLGKKRYQKSNLIPSVVYTHPEIATVGLGEEEGKSQGLNLGSAKYNFAANGRSVATGNGLGVAKLVFEIESRKIVGVQVVGPIAGDILQTALTAMEFGATLEDIAQITSSHPSYVEILTEAARSVC